MKHTLYGLAALALLATAAPGAARAADRTSIRLAAQQNPNESGKQTGEPDPELIAAIKALKLETYVPLERLTQLNNGPGVLVCAPAVRKPDAAVAEFTEAMGRWLQLMVGGHGELGRTPLWTPTDRAWNHFQGRHALNLDEAARMSQYLGITHVAVGEVTPDAAGHLVTYRVWAVPEKQPIGGPITATGSLEELRDQMPRLAAEIARALGVASPRVPAGVGETLEELRLLGSIPWIPGPRINGEPLNRLRALAAEALAPQPTRPHRPLLAAFLYMINRGGLRQGGDMNALAPAMPRIFPDNAIVFGEIGRQTHWAGRWDPAVLPQDQLAQLLRRFPDNYLLRTGEAYFQEVRRDWPAARLAAQHACAASMRSTEAWIHLDNIITLQADTIRRGRYVQDLSPEELRVCKALYGEELKSSRESVRLDPDYAVGWRKVSSAAGFVGEAKLADEALWKCIALRPERVVGPDPEDHRIFWWGLELYQRKWYPDPEKLEKVAQAAIARAARWSPAERVSLAISAFHADRLDLARMLIMGGDELVALEEHIALHDKPARQQ